MYRRLVPIVTILMLFSSLGGAMVPMGVSDIQMGPMGISGPGNNVIPMNYNGSDQGKYDAMDYDVSLTFDQATGNITATASFSLKALKDMTFFNTTLLGNMNVVSVKDGSNNSLVYGQNNTLDRLQINLTGPLSAGSIETVTVDYYGNLTYSTDDDFVEWGGVLIESRTPWYPQPYHFYNRNMFRPRSIDLHNITINALVPSNWTVVSIGSFDGVVVQGPNKNFTYSSTDPVRGASLVAGEYISNSTIHSGVNLTTYLLDGNATQSGTYLDKAAAIIDWMALKYGTFPYPDFRIVEIMDVSSNVLVSDQALMVTENHTFDDPSPPIGTVKAMADQFFLYNSTSIGDFDAWLGFAFSEYAAVYYQLDMEGKNSRLKNDKFAYGSGKAESSISTVSTSQSRFERVTINKGSYVLHMFRYLVGDTVFDKVMRAYVTASAGNTVDLDTFMGAVGQQTTIPLDWFWEQWLNTTKTLDYSIDSMPPLIFEEDGVLKIKFTITKVGTAVMPVDLSIKYVNGTYDNYTKIMDETVLQKEFILNATEDVEKVILNQDLWLLDVDKYNDEDNPDKEDLEIKDLSITPSSGITQGDTVTLKATVKNIGMHTFDVTVGFYDNGTSVDKVTVLALDPLAEATASVQWDTPDWGERDIMAFADSDDVIMEFSEGNNKVNTTVTVAEFIPDPDLYFLGNITASKDNATEGDTILLNTTVFNDYKLPISGVTVEFKMDATIISNTTLGTIPSNSSGVASASWLTTPGTHIIYAMIHAPLGITESDTDNNQIDTTIIINAIPIANPLEVSNYEPYSGEEIEFTASAINDGPVTGYMFDYGDGTITDWMSKGTVKYAYSSSGLYEARLKVKDQLGIESQWSEPTEVNVQNTLPEATFKIFPDNQGTVNTVFTFKANATDPDGTIASYYWDFGDGTPTTTEESPTHKFLDDEEFTVTLTVTDNDGQTSPPVTKSVLIDNLKPVAVGSISPTEVFVNDPVTFDASGSWDPDDTKDDLSFKWKADGASKSSKMKDTNVKFSRAGDYTITLTVTDDDGDESELEFDLKVNERTKTNGNNGSDSGGNMLYYGIGGAVAFIVVIILVLLMMKAKKAKDVPVVRSPSKKLKRAKRAKKAKMDDDDDIEEVEEVEEEEDSEE